LYLYDYVLLLLNIFNDYFVTESSVVEVDEVGHKVRPASKRRTIILREIPEGTKHEVCMFFYGLLIVNLHK